MTTPQQDAVKDGIRSLGSRWNSDVLAETRALYQARLGHCVAHDVRSHADLAYGPDPRHRLDVYWKDGAARPVLLFVPGGGYVSGEKDDGVFYRNLGLFYAARGYLTAIMNYRLAPAHCWPAAGEDVRAAVACLQREAPRFGGDPAQVFMFGHSAGATHVASYLFDPRFHPENGAGVRAAALLSGGGYGMDNSAPPGRRAYFGDDVTQWAERSPITHVARSAVPLLIGIAELDPPVLAVPSFELAKAVTLRDGRTPPFHVFDGHNHISTIFSIGSGDDVVGNTVDQFFSGSR